MLMYLRRIASLINEWKAPLIGVTAVAIVSILVVQNSDTFRDCIENYQYKESQKTFPNKLSEVPISFVARENCWGYYIRENANGIVALFTILLAGSTIGLWLTTKGLINAGQRQFVAAHRPWVGVLGVPEITTPLTFDAANAGAVMTVLLTIKNVGSSPAFHVVLMNPRLIVGLPRRDPRSYIAKVEYNETIEKITSTAGVTMVPGDQRPWPLRNTKAEFLDEGGRPVSAWLSGYLAYRDEFNRLHTSSFLFSLVTDGDKREISPDGIIEGRFEPFGVGWNAT